MVEITVRVEDLTDLRRKMARAAPQVKTAVASQAAKDTEPYVPMLTGSLKNRTQVPPGTDMIIYPGPYAHFLYHGEVMVDPQTHSPYARQGVRKVYAGRPLVMGKTRHAKATDHWFEVSKKKNLDKWVRVAGRALQRYGFSG